MYADDYFEQISSSPSPPERSNQQDPIDDFDEYQYGDHYEESQYVEYDDDYDEPDMQFNVQSRPNYPPPAVRPTFHSRPTHYPPPQPPPPQRGANPRNSAGIRLNPVSDLPDVYRGIFKFPVFNAVQSTCFPTVVSTDENMVISAPTGSGKTALFELAIIRMLKQVGESFKCVYMAPTKALCSERQRDWSTKFSSLGIKCCELTGDTVQFGKGVWGDAKAATIIITTSEKWDSLTRNWSDHGHILARIQLFLVDEVHILNESRGSTLEVVISRMKSRGTAVRFLLVSATVPNIQDIASWIGNQRRDGPASVFEFGEEFRPCKLTRHVIAIDRSRNENDFSFARKLDYKLFPALQAHAVGKPILIFVATRKGVTTTANQLMTDYADAEKTRKKLPWSHPTRTEYTFREKVLNELAKFGIGIHHAGLTMDDRRAVEDLYLKGVLRVVVATSTLAVGVNLPAHTVCIKGVHLFQNNASVEYSDLDVMQMLGRAGRPQFDKDGIAIIMCEMELESKYRQLVQGKTIVESSLHTNLAEHINSEIGLGTITSVRSAKEWLRGSFLFQRVKKNPAHYSLGKGDNQSWEERIDDMVMQSIDKLRTTKLINDTGAGSDALASTDYGDIMSKFYIRQSTMSLILALPERPSLRDILEMISASEELSETKLRVSEKTVLNKLRRHNDMRFEVKKVEKTSDKIFLLIQAVLSGISLNAPEYKCADSQLNLEAFSVFKHVARIARVVVEVAVVQKRGAQLKHGLELVRCLTVKAWEDRPIVLKQIESIGDKSIKVLAENGITSFALLAKQEPYRIETLLNRRSPFGLEVLASVNELPAYVVTINEVEVHSNGGKDPVEIDLSITCGLEGAMTSSGKSKKQKGLRTQMTAIATLTSDLEFLDFRRIPTKALKDNKTFEITVELTKPSQSVTVLVTSEAIAGVTITETYKPKLPYKEYPTRDTRPPSAIDLDLAGLEDDPDFWKVSVDGEGNFEDPRTTKNDAVVRDLTQRRSFSLTASIIQAHHLCLAKKTQPSQAPPVSSNTATQQKPEKLPNGNYKCNHACKDKTKCRHLCCRDGLPEPPRPPKKRPADEPKTVKSPIASPVPAKKATKANLKPDNTIRQLEKLHERTNVSLKLSQGSRLNANRILDFTIELTNLNDGEPPPTLHPVLELSDDDDLPEAQELIKAARSNTAIRRNSSPETNYSDSEIDSLIRNAPSELTKATSTSKTKAPARKKAATPVPSRKRKHRDAHNNNPPKRAHFEVNDSDEITAHLPLFDKEEKASSDDSEMAYYDAQPFFNNYDDDLPHAHDPDVEFVSLPTPPMTDDDRKTTSDVPHRVISPDVAMDRTDEDCMEGANNDLMEFDAWLNSGAVEIV
ncbi:hypothetical protein C8F01DRAFT_1360827 [Mycena amicta]|nr:hypothetical protein C8F01DRAFT_1360827 [Mycena amicta]